MSEPLAPVAAPGGRGGSEGNGHAARLAGAAWLLGGFCITLPFTIQLFRSGDEWWHLALGRLILSHGIPTTEPFSFVATQHPWVEQQWLYEAALASLVRLGGDGLASLALGLVGSLALLVAALAVPRSARISRGWGAAAMLLGGLMAGMALGVRAETVSALGVALTLLTLVRWRDGNRWVVWLLPPMFLLWANLDAGFIAGLALLAFALVIQRPARSGTARVSAATSLAGICVGAAAAGVVLGLVAGAVVLVVLWAAFRPVPLAKGVSRRPLAIASTAAAVLTLVNPAGPGIYAYVAETIGNPLLSQLISAWQSPNFHDALTRLIEVVAALLVLFWLIGRRPRIPDALLATAALLFTLQAVRKRQHLRGRRDPPDRRIRGGGLERARAAPPAAPARRPPSRPTRGGRGGGGERGLDSGRGTPGLGGRGEPVRADPRARQRDQPTSRRTSPASGCSARTATRAISPTASPPVARCSCMTRSGSSEPRRSPITSTSPPSRATGRP